MLYNVGYRHDHAMTKPPARAVTWPKQRPRHNSQSMPVDPEDLSRRLRLVLAEQNARAEQKKRTRAGAGRRASVPSLTETSTSGSRRDEKAASGERHNRHSHSNKFDQNAETQDGKPPHYVPQVAALQFATTTTADNMTSPRTVHRLSQKALKFHLGGPNAAASSADQKTAPADQHTALRKAQSQRGKVYKRNQFQNDRILEAAAAADEERENRRRERPKQGWEAHLPAGRRSEDAVKRLSTGDPGEGRHSHETADSDFVPLHEINAHRVDWTQSDETGQGKLKSKLRKSDSLWTLRGRLGSLTKHGREDKTTTQTRDDNSGLPEASIKSPKIGFFARLRPSH
ncbi:hypothetical protein SODALDRAFT_92445 [Sodiomyces alkalinus F11]|uniref:Uncharacterized protein n=1 Tax=Sodiomyces alkalinus (strain CBS 110278 / VKM F-3762 / F11) TaxID=1314773 RepID=A0A3N2Q0P8_SODAK|nr:hypothetical protein SODALDRAFT_92445 [Sodiomyces alkalinus F11]ROT40268.1 hypothetical protein SODALDRAFT_92445 [Sodiomyces alkalinus F11]